MKKQKLWFRELLTQLVGGKLAESKPEGPGKLELVSKPPHDDSESGAQSRKIPNLDGAQILDDSLETKEKELLERIRQRIEAGEMELPQLPATTLAMVNLAGKPGVDVGRVLELISSDPSLAGELLRISNSVLYATHVRASTLNEAVMRIGLKGLGSLIFSVSVKKNLMKVKGLTAFSHEIWRQAFSMGTIARKIAPIVGFERERAFLIGLLHDVGKITLLAMLSSEIERGYLINPATVGRVFCLYHEVAGKKLANTWRLDEELTAVAGQHHDFSANKPFLHAAALASLTHKLDLYLSLDDEEGYRGLVMAKEFDCLGVSDNRRHAVLDQARRAFEEQQEGPQSIAA